jgi:hypothetical protein
MAVRTPIKTWCLPFSPRVEVRPSRLFEAGVFTRNFGWSRGKAVKRIAAKQGVTRAELSQDRANRGKEGKVFCRQIDILGATLIAGILGDVPTSVHNVDWLSLPARTPMPFND